MSRTCSSEFTTFDFQVKVQGGELLSIHRGEVLACSGQSNWLPTAWFSACQEHNACLNKNVIWFSLFWLTVFFNVNGCSYPAKIVCSFVILCGHLSFSGSTIQLGSHVNVCCCDKQDLVLDATQQREFIRQQLKVATNVKHLPLFHHCRVQG